MSKKEAEMSNKILHYLEQQNRPYSTNDIFLNLHKEIGKTAVQKSLDTLVQVGKVKEKTYGKQKVYVADQNKFPPLNETQLQEMDKRINTLSEELKHDQHSIQELEAKFKTLSGSLTTEEALEQTHVINAEIATLQEKLVNLQSKQVFISEEERKHIQYSYDTALKEWKKRKRLAKDILDAIMEGYPKSKKELFEDIGIETDEDVGVTMPTT